MSDHFIEKGLSETSTRSLSSNKIAKRWVVLLFSSKDEAVILCAEEAALRLENAIVTSNKRFIESDLMMNRLKSSR